MSDRSRRRFLAALGGTTVVAMSGCTGGTDDQTETDGGSPTPTATPPATTSETGDGSQGNDHGVVDAREMQPTVYGSHKYEPHPHPDFDGITTGMWVSTGRITRPHRPVVTWIRSAGETEVPIGFDSRPVRNYLRETSFDEQGVLVLRANVTSDCDAVDIADVTVESERIVVETLHERIESGRDECRERSPADSYPAWSVGIAARLPVGPDRPLAVVERNGTTWSNRYRVALERIDNDGVIYAEADGVPAGEVPTPDEFDPTVREAIEGAIEESRWQTREISESLARALAEHRFVRDGETYYELDATVPMYRVFQESAPVEDVPEDAAVATLDSTESEVVEHRFVETVIEGPVETPYLPTAFRRFVQNNDYVRWRERYYQLSIERDDPGSPYVLRADPGVSPHSEVYRVNYNSPETDRSEHWIFVSDISEFEGTKREELEAAADGGFETYNLPTLFRDHRNLVGIDGQTYRIRITDVVGTADRQFDTAPRPS